MLPLGRGKEPPLLRPTDLLPALIPYLGPSVPGRDSSNELKALFALVNGKALGRQKALLSLRQEPAVREREIQNRKTSSEASVAVAPSTAAAGSVRWINAALNTLKGAVSSLGKREIADDDEVELEDDEDAGTGLKAHLRKAAFERFKDAMRRRKKRAIDRVLALGARAVLGREFLAKWDWAIPLLTDVINLAIAAGSAVTNPPDTTSSALWSALKWTSTAVNLAFSVLRGGVRIVVEVLCSSSVRRRLLPWHRSGKARLRAKIVRSGASAGATTSGRSHSDTVVQAGKSFVADVGLTSAHAALTENVSSVVEPEAALEADRQSRRAAQLQQVEAAAEVLRELYQRQWFYAAAACAVISGTCLILWLSLFAAAVGKASADEQTWALATAFSWRLIYTLTLLPLAGCFLLAAMVASYIGLRRKPSLGLV
jgi:hypothetical protein